MSKYHSVATVIDGIRFASRKESRRYQDLCLLEKAGEIGALELQPRFDLLAFNAAGGSEVIGHFTLDFAYLDKRQHRTVYEDVKGGRATRTEAYQLRKRILKANYGIDVTEV